MLGSQFQLKGGFWYVIGALNANFNMIGFAVIGVFIAAWIGSVIVYRYTGLDEIPVRSVES